MTNNTALDNIVEDLLDGRKTEPQVLHRLAEVVLFRSTEQERREITQKIAHAYQGIVKAAYVHEGIMYLMLQEYPNKIHITSVGPVPDDCKTKKVLPFIFSQRWREED